MKVFSIETIDLEKAKKIQFKLVDVIHQNFDGYEFLQGGDYGVVPGVGCPRYTRKVEDVLERFFEAEDAVLVRGSGTGAIRNVPVSLAIQAEEGNKIVDRLNSGEVNAVKSSFIANAQFRVILVEFEKPIAKAVLKHSTKLGVAPYPIGAESKYEVTAMFYRVSGTFLKANPRLEDYMIRINPMRAGADTVIRVLKEAIVKALEQGEAQCF